jgi:hydroxypyruvate reductase
MTGRFDPSVLAPAPELRGQILTWLEAGLAAVDPERLTAEALVGQTGIETVVIAIGKAAPAMARGAASVLDVVGGVCVSDHREQAPEALTFRVGDHPVPGPASLEAAAAVLDAVRDAPISTRLIALVSGGGSALCETPRDGVPPRYLSEVNRTLIAGGADIEEINLVRAHLSAIKCGGVSRAAGRPIETFVISDVAGAPPGVVASGPTVPRPPDPGAAAAILRRFSIDVPPEVLAAMSVESPSQLRPEVILIADGLDAARGVEAVAPAPVQVASEWLTGEVEDCLDRFLDSAGPGVTIGVGETVLEVGGRGSGGRNTHAALLAATRLAGSDDVFTAFATDGVDGSSGAAGGIVDGSTISRGGDPGRARAEFDTARYLAASSDLLKCQPTGTNVSDIWILWRPNAGLNVE